MSDQTNKPRKRGRPPHERLPLPPSDWGTPEVACARGDISLATLWRCVADGRLTPPSYIAPKTPRFHLPTFDADLMKLRAKPSENEAGRRAAQLAAARARHRAKRAAARGDEATA